MKPRNNSKKSALDIKITTIKIKTETKDRLDHLKEFERESYDELVKKMLFILNNLRSNPEVAQGILRNIDLKHKRKEQVYSSIPEEKAVEIRKIQEKNPKPNINLAQKFILNKK